MIGLNDILLEMFLSFIGCPPLLSNSLWVVCLAHRLQCFLMEVNWSLFTHLGVLDKGIPSPRIYSSCVWKCLDSLFRKDVRRIYGIQSGLREVDKLSPICSLSMTWFSLLKLTCEIVIVWERPWTLSVSCQVKKSAWKSLKCTFHRILVQNLERKCVGCLVSTRH